MCLAIPGKIESINNSEDYVFKVGKVSFNGIIKKINLGLVPEAKEGDYVLVHVGLAMSIIDEKEAEKTMAYLNGSEDFNELKNSDL
tara:strand:- start:1883 stop:2140 length:258 start_codon:yes stop_codon:yes gene_type:complete